MGYARKRRGTGMIWSGWRMMSCQALIPICKPSAKGVQSEDCRPKSRVLAVRLQRRGARASRSGCQVFVARRPGCPKLSCQL